MWHKELFLICHLSNDSYGGFSHTEVFNFSLFSFMVSGFHDILRKAVPTPISLLGLLWFYFNFYIKFLSHLEFISVWRMR